MYTCYLNPISSFAIGRRRILLFFRDYWKELESGKRADVSFYSYFRKVKNEIRHLGYKNVGRVL